MECSEGPVGVLEEWTNSGPPSGALRLTTSTLPVDDSVGYSFSKSIYDLRTSTRALIRVRRASLGPQGRVPPGVHGEAR